MDAFERGDSGLPGPVPSFKIGSRVLKLGDPIHSVGIDAVEKRKWLNFFRDQYATARVDGVFMGRGAGKKYRVKWNNLSEELECYYGAGHNLFKDPAPQFDLKKTAESFQSTVDSSKRLQIQRCLS